MKLSAPRGLTLALFAAVLGLTHPLAAQAADGHQYDACFSMVGSYYHINPLLLRAIARRESQFNPLAINRNHDSSIDLGLMQINSNHLPDLVKAGFSTSLLGMARRLLNEPCLNIGVGAAILAGDVRTYGMTWNAIGAYNARDPLKRKVYAYGIATNLIGELRAVQKKDGN